MTPFFDPSKCPVCFSLLPAGPMRCPACGVELTGDTVAELVTTLRRADSLVDQMRADMAPVAGGQPQAPVSAPQVLPRQDLPEVVLARSWFTGKSVGVILLILGALCVLAAGAVFIAVAWFLLPLVIRALILVVITAGFGFFAHLALRRGLQATAESMAAVACGMFVLDLSAARRAGLSGLADLTTAPYEIVAGALLVAAAGAGALIVRSRHGWLWSLDAAVAVGMARAAIGVLRVSSDGYAVSSVAVTVTLSLLYLGWGRLRLPVAMWSALCLGALTWVAAVAVGTHHAADRGSDVERLVSSWPALTMALVAGIWSVGLTQAVWRRLAACLCLLPGLMVLEVVGWSHGWVVGTAVMLVGYVIAALASERVPTGWSPAVGGAALVLGLSSAVGLLPAILALADRTGLAFSGSWPGAGSLPPELHGEDVGPWLLPLTASVVLALLPRVTIGRHRVSLNPHHSAGVFVATLAVLPVLYGAGFWMSMTVLVGGAVVLLYGARLWRHDSLLVLAFLLLAILRICAYYDNLADPLAWTLLALAALAWAGSEGRRVVRAGFLTAAGLFALAGAAQWLTYAQVPRQFHGLVIVGIGSLGLLASQRLRTTAMTRQVAEVLSVTWAAAGLAMAGSSPSHRALELTVAGAAAGIAAYLSEDRRRAGWVSGLLLTVASWIRLADADVQAVEWYTVPAAVALLFYGTRRLRHDRRQSTWRCLGPGTALALTPSLFLALAEPVSWRGLFVGFASVSLVALGVQLRLAAPFALGVVATGLLALRNIWPVAAFIPRWSLLFLIGGVLLVVGMTWEARVNDVRAAGGFVRGLR